MKIISMTGLKGGSGRSTSCAMLAHTWATRGKKVLAIDLDASTRSLSAWLEDWPGGRLVPAGPELLSLEEAWARDPLGVHKAKEWLLEVVAGPEDLVILDHAPRSGVLALASLAIADVNLVPVPLTPMAAATVGGFVRLAREVGKALGLPGEILWFGCMADRRTALSEEVLGELREGLGAEILKTVIPVSTAVARAAGEGGFPGPGEPISQAYEALAMEIERRKRRR